MHKRLASLALLALLAAAPARAETPRPAGWQTWTWDGSCYALVYADHTGSVGGRSLDRAYIAVKHVPKEKTYDGVTVVSGMEVPAGAEAIVDVGGQEYPLLVFQGAGFVRSGEPERSLVEALGKATEAKVTWMFKDQLTVQNYRFEGFQAAKRTIDAGCPRPGKAEAGKAEEAEPAPKPPAKRVKTSRHGRG